MIDEQDIDALMEAVAEFVSGYIAKQIDPIRQQIKEIPAGLKGEDGKPGESIEGRPGKDGRDGVDGKAIDGKDGRDGRDGKDGRDGDPGRDAMQIEFLPMIEEGKTVPRGTFALSRGGIMHATKNGSAADIWETAVDGIADFDVIEEDNLRTFTVLLELTSGRNKKKSFTLPVLLDRGVFRDGTEYEKGDVVTWDSSMWVCIVERTKAKPGTADWRMCVKKGQNGKDGKDGKDGGPAPGVKL